MAEVSQGELVYFPGVEQDEVYTNYDTEYAEQHSGVIVDACLRLGLDPRFAYGFSSHLNDLNLVLAEDLQRLAEEKGEPKQSRLDLQHLSDVPLHVRQKTGAEVHLEWDRLFIASQTELRTRADELQGHLDDIGFGASDPSVLGSVALDWVFAEQSMTALGNACYMQRTYTGYKKDFNGQSPCYRTQYTVSLEFLKSLSLEDPAANVQDDFMRLQQGFGLMMLHGSLTAREVATKSAVANWVTAKAGINRPKAYNAQEIAAHLRAIKPIDEPDRPYQEFYANFLDRDDEDDDPSDIIEPEA